jgi:signal transduction histidine kinase
MVHRQRAPVTGRTRAHDRVRLTVQDVGVGLEAHVMAKLFQAFFTTKSSGMGIGLSVSRSIIENMVVVCGVNRMTPVMRNS